jgi:hypothetical protein
VARARRRARYKAAIQRRETTTALLPAPPPDHEERRRLVSVPTCWSPSASLISAGDFGLAGCWRAGWLLRR